MKDKKEKDIKRKFIRRYLIILGVIFVFLIGSAYVAFAITHKDKNRAPSLEAVYTTSNIYNKAIVESFSNTKDTGCISFSFSDDDINNLLSIGSKEILNNKEETIYYEFKDNNPIFYIDLKPRLGVKTRVVLSLELASISDAYTFEYKVSSVTMGKLPYTHRDRYLNASFFEDIKKHTSLPVSFNESKNRVIISPLEIFSSYYPKDGLFKVVNELVSVDRSSVSLTYNPFSFVINLSSFRNANHISHVDKINDLDIPQRVTSLLTTSYLDEFIKGESKTLTKISIDEYNSLLSSSLVEKDVTRLTSNLTNEVVILSVKELYSSLSVDKVRYTFVLSINGYEIDINIDTLSCNSYPKFVFDQTLDDKVSISHYEFDVNTDIGLMFMSYLDSALISLSENNSSYIRYTSTSNLLEISFFDIVDSLDYNISPYRFEIKLDNINLDGFNLIVSK